MPIQNSKTAVAVSGGVDSLYALWKLHQEGHDLIALHARLLDKEDGISELEALCRKWDIPFHCLELREEFQKKVILPFVLAHADNETPNPCAWCNRQIKFGLLWEKAQELGANKIATGHYAEMIEHEVYGMALKSAYDNTKDQSYFLALTHKAVLEQAVFPLAYQEKKHVREILNQEGIPVPLPKESQEICFVSGNNHVLFLEEKAREWDLNLGQAGAVKLLASEEEQKIFDKFKYKHKGLWQYTEGQRRGLGMSWQKPLYVIHKERETNTLYLGDEEQLVSSSCTATALNFFVPFELWQQDKIYVRTRFRQQPMRANVKYNIQNQKFEVRFLKKEPPTARGQILAVYDETGFVLAGGVLE